MIFIISSAKTLKKLSFSDNLKDFFNEPFFKKEALELANILKQKNKNEITKLLDVSKTIGELNYQRYQSFPKKFEYEESYPAIFLYYGDVFKGFKLEKYNFEQFKFLQEHCRILSGLYGILKPFDLIYPYRLEMATHFSFNIDSTFYNSLYEFWSEKITNFLKEELKKNKNPVLINLASIEYSKVINKKSLSYPILNINFQEKRNGEYKTIALNSKRARGKMANWIIENQITDTENIKNFKLDSYKFSKEKSTEWDWYFLKG